MKKSFKFILTTLLLLTLVFSCKKHNVSPDETKTTSIEVVTPDTNSINTNTTIITPTVAVNVNTISIQFYMQTISGNYGGTMVPSYTGSYKVNFTIRKNGVYVASIQPPAVVLNCTCNPRTIYIPGFKVGDTITIYWSLSTVGGTNHLGLPSVVYDYKQTNNAYHTGNYIYQKKQGNMTFIIQ